MLGLFDSITERRLKRILRELITHYNRGRPYSALGPGFPDPTQATVPDSGHRHRLPPGLCVARTYIMNITWRRRLRNSFEYFRITGFLGLNWPPILDQMVSFSRRVSELLAANFATSSLRINDTPGLLFA